MVDGVPLEVYRVTFRLELEAIQLSIRLKQLIEYFQCANWTELNYWNSVTSLTVMEIKFKIQRMFDFGGSTNQN